MGTVRRLLAGSAAGVAGYAATRLMSRSRPPVLGEESDLLGWARGAGRRIRGPRASMLYAEWFPAPAGAPGRGGGNRSAPPDPPGALVFTHGWCVTESIWHLQKVALGSGRHTLVTWDLPGHGHSTPVARGRLTLDLAVDALARVVDEVEEPEIVLVGHSLGGVLSLEFMCRHPETARRRVKGVVLAATPVMSQARWARGRWPGGTFHGRLVGRGLQLAVENPLIDRWFSREAGSHDPRGASYRLIRAGFGPEADPRLVRFVRDVAASVPPSVRADTFRAMHEFDLRPELAEIRVPSMVLYGRHDRLVTREESRLLASMLPRSRAEELADAGHALFLEQADEFNRRVATFAAGRLGRPRAGSRNGGRTAGGTLARQC
jgi:pimeloyl-ACP methyl ester carboxylesterase